MREIALATRVENREIIDFLQSNLKNRLDFCKSIITNYCDNNFCYLLFACDEEFVKICEEFLNTCFFCLCKIAKKTPKLLTFCKIWLNFCQNLRLSVDKSTFEVYNRYVILAFYILWYQIELLVWSMCATSGR